MSQKQKLLYEARDIAMHVTATIMLLCDNRYARECKINCVRLQQNSSITRLFYDVKRSN